MIRLFGKKGRHDTYGYKCLGGRRGRDGGSGVAHFGAVTVANGSEMSAKTAILRWLLQQLGLLGGH